MDFHPPQGAHTSYLRTLSKIVGLLGLGGLASQDISFKGAAHLTSNFVSVNTLKRSFFASRCSTFAGHRLRRFALFEFVVEGGRILHPFAISSIPAKQIFCIALRTIPAGCPFADWPVQASQ